MTGPTVGIYTLGCKVSQYESEAMAEEFERLGFTVLDFSEACDFYVINTCTVTAESDRKSRQVIRRAWRKNKNAHILVCGCYPQRSPNEVAKIEGVGYVIGSFGKMTLPGVALDILNGKRPERVLNVGDVDEAPFEPMCIKRSPRTRAYVKIEDGCESRCSYCAIPSARGKVRSKPRADVISEVEALSASGVREIVLTGIETGSWGSDFSPRERLCDLIAELDARNSAVQIRLGSLAPELIGREFAEGISGLKIMTPHFHVSMQSGSDNVLRGMRRRYLRALALENIERLRSLIPGAMFTSDLMVGFPGESEEDFLDTVRFVEEARLLDAHVFAYSKRHSTPAAELPGQIDESLKRKRSEALIKKAKEVKHSVLLGVLHERQPLSCIFEAKECGRWVGHSSSFIEIVCDAPRGVDLHGEIRKCIPVAIEKDRLLVEIV